MVEMKVSQSLYDQYIDQLRLDFDRPDCLSNKIKICNYLVCCGASIDLEGYPVNDKDFRTGNAGLQLLVGNPALRALIPFFYMNDDNPIKIKGSYSTKKQAVIEYAGRELFDIEILPDIDTGNSNINLEFDTLITAIPNEPYGIRSCHYHAIRKPCAFCVLMDKEVQIGPADLVDAYKRIISQSDVEPQVLLTGGTSFESDKGLSKYLPYVKELRSSFPNARIAIEASPPQNVSSLNDLIDEGMDTFAANIEFFSKENRQIFLPGKSEIALDKYAEVLKYCNETNVKTFSALIMGPEKETDCLDGVEFLARNKVPTNFICLRPFPGANLEGHSRVNPASFLELTEKANKIMGKYDVLKDLANTAGCGSCGGCSMEMNLYRLSRLPD